MRTMNKHLMTTELLALRDGGGTAAGRSHIERCESCRGELSRLSRTREQLRALAAKEPPRDLWPGVVSRVRRSRFQRRLTLSALGLAAAAALAGVIALRGVAVPESPMPIDDPWQAELANPDLRAMITRSRELEGLLHDRAAAYRVFDAPTALAVSVLEDRMLLIDEALTESRMAGVEGAVVHGLWQERVNTLESLVGLQSVRAEGEWR